MKREVLVFSYSANDLPQKLKSLMVKLFQNELYQPNFNFGNTEVFEKLYAQKKSYADIFYGEFDQLSENEQTPKTLMKIINQNTEFSYYRKAGEAYFKNGR